MKKRHNSVFDSAADSDEEFGTSDTIVSLKYRYLKSYYPLLFIEEMPLKIGWAFGQNFYQLLSIVSRERNRNSPGVPLCLAVRQPPNQPGHCPQLPLSSLSVSPAAPVRSSHAPNRHRQLRTRCSWWSREQR